MNVDLYVFFVKSAARYSDFKIVFNCGCGYCESKIVKFERFLGGSYRSLRSALVSMDFVGIWQLSLSDW